MVQAPYISGNVVAAKFMDKISYITSQRTVTTTRREVQILQLLATQAHPHIVLFLGVFETHQHVQIVKEYLAGGTLYDRIVECNRLAEYEASTVFYRLLSTLGDFSPVYVTL